MKKCMIMLGVIMALCVFQFAGTASVTAADQDTEVILAVAENPTDDEVAPAEEEGTVVEEENVDEEVNEGDMEHEEAPPEGEEGTTEEMHKSE